MQAAIEKTEVAMNDLLQLATEQAEALAVVVGDYDSPREDFDRVFADYLEKRRPIVQRMLAAHLELKEEATPEEWERLAKKAHAVVDDVVRQNLRTSSDN